MFLLNLSWNWKVELTTGANLLELKTKKRLQRKLIISSTNLMAMIVLNYILRKSKREYRFTKSRERINQPIYIDDVKIVAKKIKKKKWKTLWNVLTHSPYI